MTLSSVYIETESIAELNCCYDFNRLYRQNTPFIKKHPSIFPMPTWLLYILCVSDVVTSARYRDAKCETVTLAANGFVLSRAVTSWMAFFRT